MDNGYEVFCHWPAWGQYVWTVAFGALAVANGILIGWWAKGKDSTKQA